MSSDIDKNVVFKEKEDLNEDAILDSQKPSEKIYEKASSAKHMERRNELHNENNMRQKLLKNRKKRLNKKKINILVYVLFFLIVIALVYLYWKNKITVNQWFIDLYNFLLKNFNQIN